MRLALATFAGKHANLNKSKMMAIDSQDEESKEVESREDDFAHEIDTKKDDDFDGQKILAGNHD